MLPLLVPPYFLVLIFVGFFFGFFESLTKPQWLGGTTQFNVETLGSSLKASKYKVAMLM